jgi:processive 1,2-diacylglycerol beta-glucosyltransferase
VTKTKVLVITGSFGHGHLMVSNVLNKALRDKNIDVVTHDLYLEAHPILTQWIKSWYMTCFTHFKPTYKFFYYARQEKLDSCIYKTYGLSYLKDIINKHKPDIILNTFPTPVLSMVKQRFSLDIPIHTVITDYCVHKNWIVENTDIYYVATEKMRNDLIKRGVNKNIIKISGIPISHEFKIKTDRNAWLKKHGLSIDKNTILVCTGSLGLLKGFKKYVKKTSTKKDNQVVIICGKNQALKDQLNMEFYDYNNVLILGYTSNMNHWMSSSDLMITKPGGITLTEALTTETPVILYKPTPGQEMENAIYFQENKMAFIAHNRKDLKYHTELLLENEDKIATLKEQMRSNQKHASVETIVGHIL